MATAKIRVRRAAAAGALAAAALAVPVLSALDTPVSDNSATGKCLAWFGSRDDGQCLGYSNGSPTNIGTPNMGVWGPSSSGSGLGVTSGPLLPGQTITQGISP